METVRARRTAVPLVATGAVVCAHTRTRGTERAGIVRAVGRSPAAAPPRTTTRENPSLKYSSSTPAEKAKSRSSYDHPKPNVASGKASAPGTSAPVTRFTPRATSESARARSGTMASPAMWSLTLGSPVPLTTRSPRISPSTTGPEAETVVLKRKSGPSRCNAVAP
ncbi:MAG: hypothetical protein IPK33_00390 [Gemmatimonadetes bacterium]|nr:hypothetical protein [Gemmatimonadota bacterium]